jgi:hypothetical protein
MDQVEGHPQKKYKSDGSASKGHHLKKKHRYGGSTYEGHPQKKSKSD